MHLEGICLGVKVQGMVVFITDSAILDDTHE